MALVLPATHAMVTHVFSGTSLPEGAVVTYGVANPDELGADVAAENCHTAFVAEMLPRISSNVSIDTTRVKRGPLDIGPTGEYTQTEPGSSGAAVAPGQVAVLLQKQTSFGGRAGRGRMYVPGVPEDGIDNTSDLSSTHLGNWVGSAQDFLGALAAAEHIMYLLHDSTAPITQPSVVTALTPAARVATQRRRVRR